MPAVLEVVINHRLRKRNDPIKCPVCSSSLVVKGLTRADAARRVRKLLDDASRGAATSASGRPMAGAIAESASERAADANALVAHLLERGSHFDRIQAKRHADRSQRTQPGHLNGAVTDDDGGEASAYSHAQKLLDLAKHTLFPLGLPTEADASAALATTLPTTKTGQATPSSLTQQMPMAAPALESRVASNKPATARQLYNLSVQSWLSLPPKEQASLGSDITDACILAAVGASLVAPRSFHASVDGDVPNTDGGGRSPATDAGTGEAHGGVEGKGGHDIDVVECGGAPSHGALDAISERAAAAERDGALIVIDDSDDDDGDRCDRIKNAPGGGVSTTSPVKASAQASAKASATASAKASARPVASTAANANVGAQSDATNRETQHGDGSTLEPTPVPPPTTRDACLPGASTSASHRSLNGIATTAVGPLGHGEDSQPLQSTPPCITITDGSNADCDRLSVVTGTSAQSGADSEATAGTSDTTCIESHDHATSSRSHDDDTNVCAHDDGTEEMRRDARRKEEIREKIIRLYESHNPHKLSNVDNLMQKYSSNLDALLVAIERKYSAAVSASRSPNVDNTSDVGNEGSGAGVSAVSAGAGLDATPGTSSGDSITPLLPGGSCTSSAPREETRTGANEDGPDGAGSADCGANKRRRGAVSSAAHNCDTRSDQAVADANRAAQPQSAPMAAAAPASTTAATQGDRVPDDVAIARALRSEILSVGFDPTDASVTPRLLRERVEVREM